MKSAPDTIHLSRRAFLRLAGLTAGGVLAGGLFAPAAASPASGLGGRPGLSAATRVGVLLPASTVYPALGRNFLAGLQWAAAGRPWDLVTRETGAGASHPYEVAQQLLARENVQGIVGMIDPLSLTFLRAALQAHQATVLAVSLGENLLRPNKADAHVTYHGLDLTPMAAAFGAWAARSLGRSAVLAASCYDSGYDAFAAFRLGFENAGGRVLHTAITHLPSGGPALAGVMGAIAAARPDFVYAAYCGPAALDWVRAYRTAGLAGSIPLAGSPFLTDEALLAAHGDAALGITTAIPAAGGDPSATVAFARAYQARTGRPADLPALLGYETASILAGQPVGSRLFYLREVQRQAGGLANIVRQTLDTPAAGDSALAALRTGLHSGWLHPYLGI